MWPEEAGVRPCYSAVTVLGTGQQKLQIVSLKQHWQLLHQELRWLEMMAVLQERSN